MFISEQGAFPYVTVWVWQWGAWKHATHVIPMHESHKILFRSLWVCAALLLLFIPHLIWTCTNFYFIHPSLSTPPHHIKLFMTMTKMHKDNLKEKKIVT